MLILKVATMLLYLRSKSWQRLVNLDLNVPPVTGLEGTFITCYLTAFIILTLSTVDNFVLVNVRLTKEQYLLCFLNKQKQKTKKNFIELKIEINLGEKT